MNENDENNKKINDPSAMANMLFSVEDDEDIKAQPKEEPKKKSFLNGLFKKKNKKNVDQTTEFNNKPMKKKNKKLKLRKIANNIMIFIIFCGLLGALSGFSIIKIVINKSDVILNTSDLASKDASIIYDDSGNIVTTLGHENRISYSYNQMPQSLIDAFVAIEDSRFFEHPGFDVPRFAKALLENIKSLSFSQGGSTITMQVIKNTYFAVDTIAEKSIDRKIQEIYFSLKITKDVPRSKIIEMYINKVNYGASTRGVETASQYYFGKHCTDLTLIESAMLAGIVNSPNEYNPYYDLDACKARTNDVLYQMYNHGYINEQEYDLACKIKIENLLKGNSNEFDDEDYIENQPYIDVVLEELEKVYGIDPYYTPVKVYTAMNQTVQTTCDDIAKGKYTPFRDKNINIATICIQNYTGLIVGVCGGRNYNAARLFNYATDNRSSPGSTSKAVFTYPLAFEYCGMSTAHTITDEPINYLGTEIYLSNDDGEYHGEVTVQQTLPMSYNVPSLILYRWIDECAGENVMQKYLQSLEFDPELVDMCNEQYSIGCNGFEVSVLQMAAAESMLLSGGIYTTPHTITKIEYISNDKEPIVAQQNSKRVLSEAAAWLTTYLERIGVNGGATASDYYGNARLTRIHHNNYTVYGKTGTNGYDNSVCEAWGYPVGTSSKELYYIFGTNDFAFALWYGYDIGRYQDKTTYMDPAYAHSMKDVPSVNAMIEATVAAYGVPKNKLEMPSSVKQIVFMDGYYPYTINPEYSLNPNIVGYVKEGFSELAAWEEPTICEIEEFSITDVGDKVVYYKMGEYPEPEKMVTTGKTYDIKFVNDEGKPTESTQVWKGAKRHADDWVNGIVQYNIDFYSEDEELLYHHQSNQPMGEIDLSEYVLDGEKVYVYGYYAYTQADVRCTAIIRELTIGQNVSEIEE